MTIFDIISLLGGLAMFLYGMRLMGNSLKENASGTLKVAMEQVTNNPVKAFVLGLCVTALIQSSTATIVITSGLVGAGILTLHQSLGIIVGANVGTTVTGQIIRLLDLNAEGGTSWLRVFQPSTLAPVALIIGIVIMMSGKVKNANSVGGIAVGFGILFSGLMNMTGAVSKLSESGLIERLFDGLGANPFIGYLTGAGIAFVLQSSSATIGILQAFSMTGHIAFNAIYAVIVGVYLGDCVTTFIVCAIGAKADTRRVGIVNILFNFCKTVLVLAGVAILRMTGVLDGIWDTTVNSGIIADTNTIFNLASAVFLFPFLKTCERLSHRIVKDEPEPEEKYKEKFDALNPVFFNTPALALNSCYDLLLTMFRSARANIDKAYSLLVRYDETVHDEILAEEDEIDKMTDRVSRYSVELLPHLQLDLHVSILNQYYKVTEEFERLGDHAVNIAEHAQSLHESGNTFSDMALSELGILKRLTDDILDLADKTFRRRNVEAARQIEPLVQVAGDLISRLKTNHLKRMASGECSIYADADFTNLMVAFKRIAAICSNVGVATMVRVKPELADHEHDYYESLHEGGDETFDAALRSARDRWFSEIDALAVNGNTADSVSKQSETENA